LVFVKIFTGSTVSDMPLSIESGAAFHRAKPPRGLATVF